MCEGGEVWLSAISADVSCPDSRIVAKPTGVPGSKDERRSGRGDQRVPRRRLLAESSDPAATSFPAADTKFPDAPAKRTEHCPEFVKLQPSPLSGFVQTLSEGSWTVQDSKSRREGWERGEDVTGLQTIPDKSASTIVCCLEFPENWGFTETSSGDARELILPGHPPTRRSGPTHPVSPGTIPGLLSQSPSAPGLPEAPVSGRDCQH